MKSLRTILWGGLALASLGAHADNLTQQTISETVTVKAEPAAVWALVGNFEGVARWDPSVEKSVAVDGSQSRPTRLVVFRNGGGKEMDALDERNDSSMTLTYHMVSGSLPVSNYHAVLQVSPGPAPGTSVVSWKGTYDVAEESADPDAPPPPSGMPVRGPMIYGFDVETYDSTQTPVAHTVRKSKANLQLSNQYRAGLDGLKWLVDR